MIFILRKVLLHNTGVCFLQQHGSTCRRWVGSMLHSSFQSRHGWVFHGHPSDFQQCSGFLRQACRGLSVDKPGAVRIFGSLKVFCKPLGYCYALRSSRKTRSLRVRTGKPKMPLQTTAKVVVIFSCISVSTDVVLFCFALIYALISRCVFVPLVLISFVFPMFPPPPALLRTLLP